MSIDSLLNLQRGGLSGQTSSLAPSLENACRASFEA
jgi:hypothetical protein